MGWFFQNGNNVFLNAFLECGRGLSQHPIKTYLDYSPFCVPAKIIKLVGLKNGGLLSPIKLVTFAGTQNGELNFVNHRLKSHRATFRPLKS